jgi:hypothetical protein
LTHFFILRKHAVERTEMLDFLKEIVEGVPDPSAGGTIDLETQNEEVGKRKRGKGKGKSNGDPRKRRKKKGDASEGEGEGEGEGRSETEGDTQIDDEDEGRSGNGLARYSGGGYTAASAAEDDRPYMPR